VSAPAAGASREVRYLKTPALTRALEPIDERIVASVSAGRSSQESLADASPLPYVRYSDRRVRELSVHYNMVYHGPFDKTATIAAVQSTYDEATIQEMDLVLPPEFSAMAAERADAQGPVKQEILRATFVVHFVHYPCRRDGEKNAFWEQIRDYMTDGERTWMEAASLDVDYFVPHEVFREVAAKKGRVAADYREKIEDWKKRLGGSPDLIRDGLIMLYPDPDIRDNRSYLWGAQHKWLLDKVGVP
jgi:hypothetical protein